MSLSIIIPTMGRPSLRDTLESIEPQLGQEDEVLIVEDGPLPESTDIVSQFDQRFRAIVAPGPARDWGATPRNFAIPRATKTHLAFMDDDDLYLPGAFDAFRAAIEENPDRPHMFRMYRGLEMLWKRPVVIGANVSTQMYLIPNVFGRVGRWTKKYDGDLYFIRQTLSMYPEGYNALVWKEAVVASLTTHRKGIF